MFFLSFAPISFSETSLSFLSLRSFLSSRSYSHRRINADNRTQLRTNRTGQASSVLGAVRARHNELQRIERTLIELAAMFQDLAILVEQQEPMVQAAEQNAENTTKYIDEGNTHVQKGINHARNRRKWKWWCLLIVILIIAIAVGVGVGVAASNGAFNKSQ